MAADEELGYVYLPSRRRPTTTTAATAPATTSSPRAWSASTPRPASASGTSRWCITGSGTTTCRRRRIWSTSRSTGGREGRRAGDEAGLHLRVRSRHRTPVWPSRSARCRARTCPASRRRPTQPFPTKPPASSPGVRTISSTTSRRSFTRRRPDRPQVRVRRPVHAALVGSGHPNVAPIVGRAAERSSPGAALDPEESRDALRAIVDSAVRLHPLSQPDQARSDLLAYVGSFLRGRCRPAAGLPLVKPAVGQGHRDRPRSRCGRLWMTPNGHGPGGAPRARGSPSRHARRRQRCATRHQDAPLRDAGARPRRRRLAAHQCLRQDHRRAPRPHPVARDRQRQSHHLFRSRSPVPCRGSGRPAAPSSGATASTSRTSRLELGLAC